MFGGSDKAHDTSETGPAVAAGADAADTDAADAAAAAAESESAAVADVSHASDAADAAASAAAGTTADTQASPDAGSGPLADALGAMDVSHEATNAAAASESTVNASQRPGLASSAEPAPVPSFATDVTMQSPVEPANGKPPPSPSLAKSPSSMDTDMPDAASTRRVRSRDDDSGDEGAPDAKRTKTDPPTSQVPVLHIETQPPNGNAAAAATPATPANADAPATAVLPGDQSSIHSAVSFEEWPDAPVTKAQQKFLLERLRNTKKIKASFAFKEPVDPVRLNIPHYRDLIKEPMDLSTMEAKLKQDQYSKLVDFMRDLDLIVENCVRFNGAEHAIAQAGWDMRAYFLRGLFKMPKLGAEEAAPEKPARKAATPSTKPRRESRHAAAASVAASQPASAVTPSKESWPLNADGLPHIRRDSAATNTRPKREIHRPPSKDLPYTLARPKKKKFQQELRFCDSVLSELTKSKHHKINWPFLEPVDVVALNIPHYLKVIKKPMDLGTIQRNLKTGQYQNAKEFHNDVQLVFANCFKFNPSDQPVHKAGKELQAMFNSLWSEKQTWIAQHAPVSEPQSSDAESGDEAEADDDDDEAENSDSYILQLQQQINDLSEKAQTLLRHKSQKKATKQGKKGAKTTTAAKPKKSTLPPPPKPAKKQRKTKAPQPLSYEQQTWISETMQTLGDHETAVVIDLVKRNRPDLVAEGDLELDMEELTQDELRELYRYLKSVQPPSAADQDDEYVPAQPAKGQAAPRSKKSKNPPMNPEEKVDKIQRIQRQIGLFDERRQVLPAPATPQGEKSAALAQARTDPWPADTESSDDDASPSESEEE